MILNAHFAIHKNWHNAIDKQSHIASWFIPSKPCADVYRLRSTVLLASVHTKRNLRHAWGTQKTPIKHEIERGALIQEQTINYIHGLLGDTVLLKQSWWTWQRSQPNTRFLKIACIFSCFFLNASPKTVKLATPVPLTLGLRLEKHEALPTLTREIAPNIPQQVIKFHSWTA